MRKTIVALVLGCMLLGAGFAQAADGRTSVSGGAGYAWPENADGTLYVTAAFRFHFDDNWALEPDFGYWKQDNASELCLARGCVEFGLRDAHAGLNVLFIGTWGAVGMYTGGGAAAHWRKTEITQQVNPPHNSSLDGAENTRLGLHMIFGADFPIAHSFDITAAVRNDFIFRDDDFGDSDVTTVFKAYAGLRVYFD